MLRTSKSKFIFILMPFLIALFVRAVVQACAIPTARDSTWHAATAQGGGSQSSTVQPSSPLDFETYRSRIEPIFLKQRPGHARCYGCHSDPNRFFHLERLSDGATEWTEEQSRRNFQTVTKLVAPGDPRSRLLLIHPLAPEAGGDAFHS